LTRPRELTSSITSANLHSFVPRGPLSCIDRLDVVAGMKIDWADEALGIDTAALKESDAWRSAESPVVPPSIRAI
jgi:hypothetical protein